MKNHNRAMQPTRRATIGLFLLSVFLLTLLVTVTAPRRVHADILSCGEESFRERQATPVTKTNWNTHPSIVAIRQLVNTVNAGLKSGKYKTSKREFESCGDQYYTRRQVARNAKGVIVWYQEYFNYEDGSFNFDYYYDDEGHIRFLLGSARHANGTRAQHRIYFDASAKRLWEGDEVKGLGCPGCFQNPYPENQLATDPAKTFANTEGCIDLKPEPRPSRKKN